MRRDLCATTYEAADMISRPDQPDTTSAVANVEPKAVLMTLALFMAGCAGPPVLERQVLGYDEVTSRLEQKLLLLNIARVDNGRPVHFTSTSSIAATFDWTTSLGAGGELHRTASDSFLGLNIGASASENPTFSIRPLSGQAFTERILTPFKDEAFEFLVYQGGAIDRVTRLLGAGIEVQNADGSFERFMENNPARREEYAEFRRVAMHLRWLNDNRKLFVRTLVFEEPIATDLKEPPRGAEIINADKEGLRWRREPDGDYRLTRVRSGRVVVMNVDPMSLSDQARYELNERIKRNPQGFVHVEVRSDGPGGDFPIRGAIKLRSMLQMLVFVSNGARAVPEFDVAPDPRTGTLGQNPASTLRIEIGDAPPAATIAAVEFEGRAYSVADTQWDRATFAMLGDLFQTAVGEIKGADLPVTISK
jgi:hypothetical protein